jgi:hypothetical protein
MGIETAIFAAVAGSALSAVGEAASGEAKDAAYKFSADVNDRNARSLEIQADQVQFAEELNIVKFRQEFDNLQASVSQANRSNGWLADSGTPAKVALANAAEADEEIATRRYNAKIGARELKESAVNQRLQGTLNRMYGSAVQRAGYMKAGSSLLSGISQGARIGATA